MSTPRWICTFADPLPPAWGDARTVLGGKGASLKEMTQAGLNVPPGFTLTTATCQAYFERGQRWPDGLEQELREHVARLEAATGRQLGRGPRPLLVSVRSGAAVSMPGMMDTLLNCGLTLALGEELGDAPWYWRVYREFIVAYARTVHDVDLSAAEPADGAGRRGCEALLAAYHTAAGEPFPATPWDALVGCINAVFASWNSARAVAYRRRHELRDLAGTAVNVQAMFPSDVSGVAFTRDPTRHDADQLVIEASYGLGEAVVSGDVTPDRFIVPRADLGKVQAHLGHKSAVVAAFGVSREVDPAAASLDAAQVRELAELALRVERHFGHPVDIEWGLADGRFALLQARAIRGLEVAEAVEPLRRAEIERLRAGLDGQRRVWVVHNLAETLRAPTPLTWDVMQAFMSGDGGFGRLYRMLGYRPSRRVCHEGFLDLIAGRIYADPDRLAGLFWESMPLTYDLDALVADKRQMDVAPARFDAARADGSFLLRLPGNLLAMWRSARSTRRLTATVAERYEREWLPAFERWLATERGRDLAGLPDVDLLALLSERRRVVLDEFAPQSLLPGFLGGMALARLENQLTQFLGDADGPALARTLTQALPGDVTFEQDALLFDVASGRADLGQFVVRFGHRAIGEMELAVPRWSEDASYLEQTVARLRSVRGRDPHEVHARNAAAREEAERSLPQVLAACGGSSLREDVLAALADARRLLPYREKGKFDLMKGYAQVRAVLEELGRRWNANSDIYYLYLDELARYPAEQGRLEEEVDRRRIAWQAAQRLDLADVVDSNHLDRLGLSDPNPTGDALAGTAMAPGVATGPVRVVEDPRTVGDLGTGYVLVCASTDPGWTPLFLNAAGLIVERGGVLSHGAIVARDFGIPAIACPRATRLLADGDTVKLDGTTGRVTVLARRAGDAA